MLDRTFVEKFGRSGIESYCDSPVILLADLMRHFREYMWRSGFVEFPVPSIRAHNCCTHTDRLKLTDGRFLQDSPALALRRQLALHPKVFSISQSFRDEDVDETHLQQFYMLDMYSKGATVDEVVSFFEDLLHSVYRGSVEYISVADIIRDEFDIDLKSDYHGHGTLCQRLRTLYNAHEA